MVSSECCVVRDVFRLMLNGSMPTIVGVRLIVCVVGDYLAAVFSGLESACGLVGSVRTARGTRGEVAGFPVLQELRDKSPRLDTLLAR